MSRPRKIEPRDKQFNISVSAREFEDIRQRAMAVGMRPVHFGRSLLFDDAREVTTEQPRFSNIDRLVHSQLSRLGNNLNQMMRHLHQTGEPVPADLGPLLTDIRQIIARSFGNDR